MGVRRGVLGWDRVATFVVGLVLLVLGVAVALWALGDLAQLWAQAPQRLSTQAVTSVYGRGWWRAASTAAGVVLVLLGLWWLLAHLPRTGVGALRLPGTSAAGQLSLAGERAVAVAADVLAEVRGVRSASGALRRTRGQVVAELAVVAGPRTDLGELAGQVDAVSADLAQVLGRSDVVGRVRVRVARRDAQLSRVG